MSHLEERGTLFQHHPEALYAVDVKFQHSYCPSGAMDVVKRYYSGKHKMYGLKNEYSVLPNWLCIGISPHTTGSVHYITILKTYLLTHERRTLKEYTVQSHNENLVSAPRQKVIADKAYCSRYEKMVVITPLKKLHNGSLTYAEILNNKKIASHRIIIENYFGWMTKFWNIVSSQYRWNESFFDDIVRIVGSFTNFLVKRNPLRAEDGERYNQVRNRISDICDQRVGRRAAMTRRSRDRRRNRLRETRSLFSPNESEEIE